MNSAQMERMREEFERLQMERNMSTNEWEIRRWQELSERLLEEINGYFDFHLWVRRTYPEILDEWNALQKIKGE